MRDGHELAPAEDPWNDTKDKSKERVGTSLNAGGHAPEAHDEEPPLDGRAAAGEEKEEEAETLADSPGAVAVAGPGIEAGITSGPDEASREGGAEGGAVPPNVPLAAYVVGSAGGQQEPGGGGNEFEDAEERIRHRLHAAPAPLVSARAVVTDRTAGTTDHKGGFKAVVLGYARKNSWRAFAAVGALMVVIVTAAALMGVYVPRSGDSSSSLDTQGNETRGGPELTSNPMLILSSLPSSQPTQCPTVDPVAARLESIRSVLIPISGEIALSDPSSPQHRALRWVALNDSLSPPLRLPGDERRLVQRYVLATFYYATGGEYWIDHYNFLKGIHECYWWGIAKENDWGFKEEGVFCTKGVESGEVDFIHMFRNNATGYLPPELLHLYSLNTLLVRDNYLSGTVPEFLMGLRHLETLHLGSNQLTGSISASLGNMTSLVEMYFYINKLNGTIPESLGGLTRLERLHLDANELTGNIPSTLGDMTSLVEMFLSYNQLNGTIAESLGGLTNLKEFDLALNRLTGTIPASLANMKSLVEMKLYSNQLNGTIPEALGGLTNLKYLSLEYNELTGNIPSSLANMKSLVYMYLGENWLNGTIPESLGGLTNLRHLEFDTNELTGTLPRSFGNLKSLFLISLSENRLNGTIPESLGGLTKFERLYLSSNQLTGTLPSSLGDITSLVYMHLDENRLNGTIPESLGRLTKLKYLHLDSNEFTGSVPDAVCNFTGIWIVADCAGQQPELICDCCQLCGTFVPAEPTRSPVKAPITANPSARHTLEPTKDPTPSVTPPLTHKPTLLPTSEPTPDFCLIDVQIRCESVDDKTDCLLIEPTDCDSEPEQLVEMEYFYDLSNVGESILAITILERHRDGAVVSMLHEIADPKMLVGQTMFVSEFEWNDLCNPRSFRTVAYVEACPPDCDVPCLATDEYVFKISPRCFVEADVTCMGTDGSTDCKNLQKKGCSDTGVDLETVTYTYSIRNVGFAAFVIAGVERSRNGETRSLLDLLETTYLFPFQSVSVAETEQIDLCVSANYTTTVRAEALTVGTSFPCDDEEPYEFTITAPPTPESTWAPTPEPSPEP